MKYKICDLMNINRGASPRPIIEYLTDNGYRWLKISDFSLGDRYVYKTKEYIKEEGITKTKFLKKGTLILTNSATPGIPIFLGEDMCLHDGFLYFQNIKEEIISKEYLYYWFIFNRNNIVNQANGSVFKNLKKEIVMNLSISLPSLNTQKKVVKILDSITRKIETNNQTNDNLYKILEQYIKEHYYNNEFVRNGNVNDIGKIQGGYAFKSKDLLNETTNNKVLKIKNISARGVDIDNTQCVYDEVANKVDKKFLLLRGNVIIAMTGAELGKTGYLYGQDYRYFLNQRVGVIRGNDKYSELYLNCLFILNDMQNTLNSKGYGSAQPNISTSDIENIEIPIPKEDELETFYEKCNPIYSKMILNSEQNQSLTQLRDTLLPKLMNGEIDLDKIEI